MAKIKAKKKDNRLSVKVKLQMGEKLDDRGLEQFSVISIRGLLKLEKIFLLWNSLLIYFKE